MKTNSLFIGVHSAGITYSDRAREEHGDYKRVAFLRYSTLEFVVHDAASPLLAEARMHAAKLQARAGEVFALSVCGAMDIAAGLETGQTVRLGSALAGRVG